MSNPAKDRSATIGNSHALRWWSMLLLAAVFAGLIAIARHERAAAPPPQPVPNHAFTDARSARSPAIVWAVGDGADGSAAAQEVAGVIAADKPARVLYLGDVYERGSRGEFRSHFATVYGELAKRTAPTPGNHDWPAHLDGYDPYWRTVTGAPTPPWYAFDIGGWRILSLNSEAPHDPGAPQLRWLRRQLEDNSRACTLAFWHRPRYSAGKHGDQRDVAPLWNAVRGHATLVVNGHDHNLQRLRPRDGITEIIAGAGGHSRYSLDPEDPRLAFATDDVDGALRLELRPGRAGLSFVAVDGSVLDSTNVRCPPRSA